VTERAYLPGGSDRGTSRETALRPALAFRVVLLAIVAAFLGQFVHATAIARPGHAADIAVVAPGVLFVVAGYAALRAFTTRVWVGHSFEPGSTMYHQWTLNQTRFGRHSKAYLRSPAALRIKAPAPFGPRPQWRLTVTPADATPRFSVSAPWVTDLSRLLQLLYPVAHGDPALVADDDTRALLGVGAPAGIDSFNLQREYWWFRPRGDDASS
jgi:hypothetical protein